MTHVGHSASYHHLSVSQITSIRSALTSWYTANRRKLPWRGDQPPYGKASCAMLTKPVEVGHEPVAKKRKLTSYFNVKKTESSHEPSKSESKQCEEPEEPRELAEYETNLNSYHIWISEIMLQQTRVETVIDYWLKWMRTFPTIKHLASATLDEVNAVWAGLGYYRRAKYIHEAAQTLVDKHQGTLPRSLAELKSIRGIGDYTAGAVSSIAYNECNAAVDGNLVRVISRICAIACAASPPLKIHWSTASALVKDTDNPGVLNQALMELGACICTPKSPKCAQCPLQSHCKLYSLVHNKQECSTSSAELACTVCQVVDIEQVSCTMYPLTKVKSKVRQQVIVSAILTLHDKVLMIKRPGQGLLANQWEFPMHILHESQPTRCKKDKAKAKVFESAVMLNKLVDRVSQLFASQQDLTSCVAKHVFVGSTTHIFSHIRQTCHVFRIVLQNDEFTIDCAIDYDGDYKWYTMPELDKKPLTKCVKKQWLQHKSFDKTLTSLHNKKRPSRKKRKREELEDCQEKARRARRA